MLLKIFYEYFMNKSIKGMPISIHNYVAVTLKNNMLIMDDFLWCYDDSNRFVHSWFSNTIVWHNYPLDETNGQDLIGKISISLAKYYTKICSSIHLIHYNLVKLPSQVENHLLGALSSEEYGRVLSNQSPMVWNLFSNASHPSRIPYNLSEYYQPKKKTQTLEPWSSISS